ncbi:hypothetical protein COLO4_04417 [Corchorus olitorius]|uniref:Uncharacterized protein n=1 Tax=Corchorus olitorius TaxID=93759 RepID=A0A1R3KU71_9ROSI|nr:hypothetical protein COLO4_04417 [Corchorus olitorius]
MSRSTSDWMSESDSNKVLYICLYALMVCDSKVLAVKAAVKAASLTWRSIWQASVLLRSGSCWRIGNGKMVQIWRDPWLPGAENFRPKETGCEDIIEARVSCLIDEHTHCWDADTIMGLFDRQDAIAILDIPLLLLNSEDKDEPAEDANPTDPSEKAVFKKIWSAKIPPQNKNLWCGEEIEDQEHALRNCAYAKPVWDLLGFNEEAAAVYIPASTDQGFEVSIEIAWAVWKERNAAFEEVQCDSKALADSLNSRIPLCSAVDKLIIRVIPHLIRQVEESSKDGKLAIPVLSATRISHPVKTPQRKTSLPLSRYRSEGKEDFSNQEFMTPGTTSGHRHHTLWYIEEYAPLRAALMKLGESILPKPGLVSSSFAELVLSSLVVGEEISK